jgi:hypothetical protein
LAVAADAYPEEEAVAVAEAEGVADARGLRSLSGFNRAEPNGNARSRGA